MKLSSIFWRQTGGIVLGLCVALILLFACGKSAITPTPSQAAPTEETNGPSPAPGNLPSPQTAVSLSGTMPVDVDLDALSNLDFDTQLPEAQRIFDEFHVHTRPITRLGAQSQSNLCGC